MLNVISLSWYYKPFAAKNKIEQPARLYEDCKAQNIDDQGPPQKYFEPLKAGHFKSL